MSDTQQGSRILRPPSDPARERQLIAQGQHQPDAFRELYRHYFPRIYAYVAYRVGGRQDAEDVVAEVFLRVVKSLGRFEYRGAGSFAAWIFRIAHNRVNQFYRKQTHAFESLSLHDLPDIQSDSVSPDVQLLRKEQFARLHSLIATLSPRRQEIITLRFFGGLRNRDIAQVLGLDERTVASHLSRALADLERKYTEMLEKEAGS